jgi:hypothetical protein
LISRCCEFSRSTRVKDGRIVLDEPTDLPDGEVKVVVVDVEDEMDEEERDRLHASILRGIKDAEAGRVVEPDELKKRLRSQQ